ncbi:MAG: hypothetical protein HC822_06125 [Oscillochloris sp.]|nr:hypothetical protein [Oscillochloris sp.]
MAQLSSDLPPDLDWHVELAEFYAELMILAEGNGGIYRIAYSSHQLLWIEEEYHFLLDLFSLAERNPIPYRRALDLWLREHL